ncbi:TonB-dependent receptor [Fulvivirgaceae bacterium BMA12]|uniref:TonB-dependent receptor n=1 Tax=Agaribacillus aureus TaxID=3051825 RepID=A0ABT8L7X8_9BACT|nr:TonB-dependent receptor [Fulvivirgaceae bacterium BMA12]
MKNLLLFLTILFFSQTLFGQSGIKGQLVDKVENAPIEYASVAIYLKGDSALVTGAVTAEDGSFYIEPVKPGNYYLVAQFMGYERKTVENVMVVKNKVADLRVITLLPHQKLLDEIQVTGEKVTAIHKVDRQVFEAGKFQSSQGGTATDVLRNLPGVSVDGQGEIAVRGTTGFVVLVNGKPVQTDASVILNQLPANAIQNVELITAPSAKYDPEGKAGIINIITDKGATDGFFAQVNTRIGLPSIEDYDNAEYAQRYGGDFILNYRKGKWDLSVGGSYLRHDISGRREGDVFTIIQDTLTHFPSDGERSFDEVNYAGRFTVSFTPTTRDSYSLGFYAGKRSKDRTADILYNDNHASYRGERLHTLQYFNENLRIRKGDVVLGSFDYSHDFENKAKISTSLLYEYTLLGGPTTNRNLGWPNTSVVLQDEFNTNDNPLNGVRWQIDYRLKPFALGNVEVGYQYRNLDHTGDFVYERKNNETGIFELVPEFSSSVDLRRQIHAVYGQLSGKKGKWHYGAGLRLEIMDRELDLKDKAGTLDTTYLYDFVKPYPSANIQYDVNNALKIKAAYSRRVERTTTFKMNPFPEREHSETLEQGDPELLPEFIDLVELGAIKDFGNNSIFATAYFRNVKNLVNRVNTVYNDTILNRIYSNVGTGRSFGLELGTELQLAGWWKMFAGGNLYNFEIDGTFDNRPVNTSNWIYSFNANTTFDLPRAFSLQWSVNYISGRNTAQGEDSRFLSPNLTLKKSFSGKRLTATLQWLNMDLGLLESNEQRITTMREGEFFTTTNYVYEADVVMLNLSYTINKSNNKARFIKSEFGEKEF